MTAEQMFPKRRLRGKRHSRVLRQARKVVRVPKAPKVPNLLKIGSESTGTLEVGIVLIQHSKMSNGIIRPSEKAPYIEMITAIGAKKRKATRKIPDAKTSSTYQV